VLVGLLAIRRLAAGMNAADQGLADSLVGIGVVMV
jgi:hypothetical protein